MPASRHRSAGPSSDIRSGDVRSGDAWLGEVGAGEVGSGKVESGEVRSGEVESGAGRSRVRSRGRRIAVTLGCLAVLVAVVAVVCLLLVAHAAGQGTQLRQALSRRDPAAAWSHADSASRDLAALDVLTLPLRAVAVIPVLGGSSSDVLHLLDGSRAALDGGRQVLGIWIEAQRRPPVHHGRIDVAVVAGWVTPATTARVDADRARRDLTAVGPSWIPGLGKVRDRLLRLVGPFADTADALAPAVAHLPAALGSTGQQQYVVATLNSAELFPAGGAPLGVALLDMVGGHPVISERGQVSELTHLNTPVPWIPLPSDPWQRGRREQRLANADYSPDFPTSAEEILRLYRAQFGPNASGVVTLDAVGLQAVLRITGPVSVTGYGQVNADTVIGITLVDAYRRYGTGVAGIAARHQANNALIDAAFNALVSRPPTLSQLEGLVRALRQGHVQVYLRDPDLQDALRRLGVANALPAAPDDALGVYTINANASKVDVWQYRNVDQDVRLAADGSADVTRTVSISYADPGPCPVPDPGTGYTTCVAGPRVVLYLPQRATRVRLTVDGRPVTDPRPLIEQGRLVLSVTRSLPWRTGLSVVLDYHLPAEPGAAPGYRVAVSGQPMVHPETLTVRVTPAAGTTLSGAGWSPDGGRLLAQLVAGGSQVLALTPISAGAAGPG